MNFIGFSPVNIFSRIWYTPKHWIASARRTPIIYFASGINALKPMFAKVLLMRQNTPIGASAMIIMVISIMMSLNWLKSLPLSLHALPFSQGSHPRSGKYDNLKHGSACQGIDRIVRDDIQDSICKRGSSIVSTEEAED